MQKNTKSTKNMDAKFKLAKDVGRLHESVKFFSKNTCTPAHIEYADIQSAFHVSM